jgi:cytoskeletal protein CcmA (bactofilin family)
MEDTQQAKTTIAEDIEIVGSIKCASDIQLDGKLNGDLSCGGKALIGTTANVKGNVSAESAALLGNIEGNITAKDRIELKASARINGDIRAKRLTVEEGVTFVGKAEVNPSGTSPSRTRPAAETSAEEEAPSEPDTEPEGEAEQAKGKGAGIFGRR